MTLYKFSLSSLLVALVAFQNTYASFHLRNDEIFSIILEEYVQSLKYKKKNEETIIVNPQKDFNHSKLNRNSNFHSFIQFEKRTFYEFQNNYVEYTHPIIIANTYFLKENFTPQILDLNIDQYANNLLDKKSMINIKNKQLRI